MYQTLSTCVPSLGSHIKKLILIKIELSGGWDEPVKISHKELVAFCEATWATIEKHLYDLSYIHQLVVSEWADEELADHYQLAGKGWD
jgi:hypothetical protein